MRKNRALSAVEKIDARDALELLEGSGLSLLQAAQLACGRSSLSVPTTIEAAADALQRDNLKRKLRGSTFAFYEERLRIFCQGWPKAATLDDVSRAELRAWLVALPGSDGTRRATYRAISRLFRFALEQEPPWCRANPAEHLKLDVVKSEREIEILPVADAAAIMADAEERGRYVAALALMLFAGIRPMEIRCRDKPPLLWRYIDFKARSIRIPANIAKTRTPRIIEDAPDNLWAWLESVAIRDPEEPICPGMIRQAQRMAREAIGRDWPKDGPRHSFATYHIAQFNEIGRTSMIMGHEGSTQMIHRHYRGLATKAQALAYFAIRPAAK